MKLYAKTCRLFFLSVKWCGRIISKDRFRLDLSRLVALVRIPRPSNGAQLQQFICASNWMRSAIPDNSRSVAPLLAAMENVYAKTAYRKKAISKVELTSEELGDAEWQAFEKHKKCLHDAATLSHPYPMKVL